MNQMLPAAAGAAMDRPIVRPHARRRKLIVRAAVALAMIAAALATWASIPGSNTLTVDAGAIREGVVRQAAFRDYVPLRAEVVPLRTVILTAVSGGQVAELAASDGATVAAGTPLARLANPSLQLDVASRSADIAGQLSAISGQRLSVQRTRQDGARDVADARNALLKAETLLRQKQALFERGYITQRAIDPLRDEVAYNRARVAASNRGATEASVTLGDQSAGIAATARQLRESLAMVRASLSSLVVRAPVAGRLTAFTLQPGQTVRAGDPVGQIDSAVWKLAADVDQFYLGRVRAGLAAAATIEDRTYPLRVLKVLPQVANGRFRVEFGFDAAAPDGLNRGQTLDVRLVLGADRPATVAPAGGWLDAGGGTAFVVLDAGGRAVRRAIVTGRRNPDQVEITSGLAPGERIVTTAIGTYAPYQTLQIK